MDLLRMLFTRCAALFRRGKLDADLDEELRAHIDLAIHENLLHGMLPKEARTAALRAFGGVTQTRESYREQRSFPLLQQLGRDLRFALRQLRKSPGYSIVVIVTLALGVGANTTVFSVVDAVMLRPLPYAQPQQLVEVNSADANSPVARNVSYPDFFDWREQNHSFEHLVSYNDNSYTLTGTTRAVHLDAEIVSWDLLPMLGIQPELGRGFVAGEEKDGSKVVLISHSLWMSQFGSDSTIVGRAIHLSGDTFTVVGVMPPSFRFPVDKPQNSLWTTLAVDGEALKNRGGHSLAVMGRLRRGVTTAQGDQEMKAIASRLAKQYPDTNTHNNSAKVQLELQAMLGETRTLLLVVLGAVAFVLLIACGNIANLQLTRVRDRQREIAVRCALGAGRGSVIRQLMTESLVLSIAGGLAGSAVAFVSVPGVLALIGTSVPRAANAGVDLTVLAFALAASLLSGLIFGVVPATAASRTDLVKTLQQGGQARLYGHDRLRMAVIVGQVALGVVLTAGAGLLTTSFVKLIHTDEGFNPAHVLTFSFDTPDSAYKDRRPQFYRQYFDQLRALPGVESAAGSMILPMADDDAHISFENPERPVAKGLRPGAELAPVTPGFFQTMQIPLITGRDFTEADNMQSPQVMIVNQAFANTYFPGEDPLGKKLKPGAGNGSKDGPPWRQIVGVVGNVRHSATQREMQPAMYLPSSQLPTWCCLSSVLRTSVDPMSLEPAVRKLVASMDADIPVTDVRTMPDLISLRLAEPRFATVLFGSFAILSLVLTVVGLYGVMAYSVSQRTREIGLRFALGAERGAVLGMILRAAAGLLGTGIAIGIAAALAFGPILSKMLYGTGPRNPAVLLVVCGVMALAGLLAAYIPAARAASVDPMRALRTE
ncbi:MAG TPA: ABC transporter permease [Terracidiphilus sp.]|nr:ABC transporter permease [Terracidiphilus sp.]